MLLSSLPKLKSFDQVLPGVRVSLPRALGNVIIISTQSIWAMLLLLLFRATLGLFLSFV